MASRKRPREIERQPVLYRYFRSVRPRGLDLATGEWHCIVCGQSMGTENSRQLCQKWWCPQEGHEQRIVDPTEFPCLPDES